MVLNDSSRIFYAGYFENGTMESYGDSLRTTEFFNNGKMKFNALMQQGEIYHVSQWFPNGVLKEESEWRHDRRHGKWAEWDSTGNLIRNELYKNGEKISGTGKKQKKN